MTLSGILNRTTATIWLRLLPFTLLAVASYAHANWTLVHADAPVTTIHATTLYRAQTGQRFSQDDIVENPFDGVAQVQDESGNIVALGHGTRVMFTRDSHVALLRGWVKVLHVCNVANCAIPVFDTERTRFTPGDRTSLVIAAAPLGYASADAAYCESGSTQVLATGDFGKPAPLVKQSTEVRLEVHQFALHAASNEALSVLPSPDLMFVAAMPVTFRDALRALPMPAGLSDALPQPARPVSYDDVSAWLTSTLAVRTGAATRFTDRFHTRLQDPAFRGEIKQHIRELPDWHALVFPPPPQKPRVAAYWPSSAYSPLSVRP